MLIRMFSYPLQGVLTKFDQLRLQAHD